MNENALELKRVFRTSPERLYAVFARAEEWSRWFGLGKGAEVDLDARVGGRWQATMEAPDGSRSTVAGVFHEVTPNTRLIFTWQWGGAGSKAQLVTVSVAPADDGAELTLLHEALPSPDSRRMHHEGWVAALDRLPALLEN
ncbi:MAG: SRPBCC family protein [Bradymonadia bacterium]